MRACFVCLLSLVTPFTVATTGRAQEKDAQRGKPQESLKEILERISRDPSAVLRGRVGLSETEKAELVLRLAPDTMAAGGGA